MSKIYPLVTTIALIAAAALFAVNLVELHAQQAHQPKSGSVVDNIFIDDGAGPTASVVTIGKDIDTTLVATNTARVFLEFSNISTSSPGQALYCNTNDRAAVINSGFVVFASTTKTITNLRGALHCKYQSATSGVSVIER